MPLHKRLQLAAALLLLASIAVALLAQRSDAPQEAPAADPFSPAAPLASDADVAKNTKISGTSGSSAATRSPHEPSGQLAASPQRPHAAPSDDAPAAGPTVVVIGPDGRPTTRASDPLTAPDWDALPHEPFGPDAGWADPTQQEILGPPRWMAQPTSASARELAAAIDAGPAPAELKRQEQTRGLREAAARLAQERGARCINKWHAQQPDLTGRMDVALTLHAAEQRATVAQVRVVATTRVEESGLSECVRASLANAQLAASGALPQPVTFEFSLPVGP